MRVYEDYSPCLQSERIGLKVGIIEGENKIMTIRFIKDVVFKDQNNDSVKIKDGKILTAKVVTNEDGKEVYEIKQKKNVFTIPSTIKDVMFVVL